VDIDRVRPAVQVTKVRAGATYFALGPVADGRATDRHSGVATYKVTRRTKGNRVVYRAVATEGTLRGPPWPYLHGAGEGRDASQLCLRLEHPRPPAGGGVPFKRMGKNIWALGVTFEHAMRHTTWWNIGIRVGTRTPVTAVKVVH
jgi:hypothetical protein